MKNQFSYFFVIIGVFGWGAFGFSSNSINELENKIEDFQYRIDELACKLDSIEEKLTEGLRKIYFLDASVEGISQRTSPGGVMIDLREPGDFQFTSIARGLTVPISLRTAQPYMEGYKIVLSIGNPNNATFHSPTLTVKWSLDDCWWTAMTKDDVPTIKKKILQGLPAGKWTDVEVYIQPKKLENIKMIFVQIKSDELGLKS